jgi:hypothetical protein
MDAGERWFERRLVETIASHDFGRRTGRVDTLGMAGKTPHRAAVFFQASKKTAADVTRGAGEQNHSTHVASLSVLLKQIPIATIVPTTGVLNIV